MFPSETTVCVTPSCTEGQATLTSMCDGAGTCQPPQTQDCGLYTCGTNACRTSCSAINDCDDSAFCNDSACEVDVQPPTVTFTLPPYVNGPLNLVAHVVDNGVVVLGEVLVNGVVVSPGSDANGFDELTGQIVRNAVALTEGLNTVLVRATDRAGNVGGSQVEVTLDTVPPALSFLTPSANQAIGSTSVDATLTVVDASPTVVELGGQSTNVAAGGGLASATIALFGEGNQTLGGSARDAAGNVATASVTILVDLTAPVLDIDVTSGAIYGPQPGNLLPVTVHVDDLAATTLLIAGQPFAVERGGGVVHAVVSLTEGTNEIAVEASNETGRSASLSRVVTYDISAPQATIVIPEEGSFVRGGIELTLDASDAISSVASASFQVDGLPAVPAGGAGTLWTAPLQTGSLSDGIHHVLATLSDVAGNVASIHRDFTVDNTAPSVQIVRPTAGDIVSATVSIEVAASDATSGIGDIDVQVNGESIGSCPAAPCVLPYDTAFLPDGNVLISATALDRAGNPSLRDELTVVSVNIIPANFLVSPLPGSIVQQSLTVAVSVDVPQFKQVECSVDGESLGVSTNPTFSQVVSTANKLDGPIVVSCTAQNRAGTPATESVTVTVKNWSLSLEPKTLNLKSNGNPVTLAMEGGTVGLLLPVRDRQLVLAVPGGSPVPLLRPDRDPDVRDSDGDGLPELSVQFDRAQLQASIRAGIASGAIDPARPVTVRLLSGSRELGSDAIRVNP